MSEPPIHCEHCGEEHPAEVQRCPRVQRIFRPERFYPLGSMLGGKYRLERVLGSGGMAAVFEATHTLLRKQVALKVLMPEMVGNAPLVARMVREARSASSTGHVNIAQVTDMGLTASGAPYLVMDLVEGETLRQLLSRRQRLPEREAVPLMDQVLAGLASVHAKGIIHRDLKPDNVMVEQSAGEPVVKILDFGIAKPLQDEDLLALTRRGQLVGSPRHMAPEQALGRGVDARSDIFAAGALLYQLLTGEPAIGGQTIEEVIGNARRAAVVPPSALLPEIAPKLEEIVLKALALEPEQRFADARAFREALAPFLSAERKRQPSTALAALTGKSDAASPLAATLERRQKFAPADSAEATPSGDEEQSLELDLDKIRPRRSTSGQLYRAPSFWRRHYRVLLVGVVLLGLSVIGLTQHGRLRAWITGEPFLPPQVLIVIDPSPKKVRISVDGEPHDSMTVTLPRGERDHLIRVEARGYRAKKLEVRANETQLIRVRLERLGRRKRMKR